MEAKNIALIKGVSSGRHPFPQYQMELYIKDLLKS